jgi:hypothetical protein
MVVITEPTAVVEAEALAVVTATLVARRQLKISRLTRVRDVGEQMQQR